MLNPWGRQSLDSSALFCDFSHCFFEPLQGTGKLPAIAAGGTGPESLKSPVETFALKER